MLTHYLVLGLSRHASTAEIRQRYLQLVRENPPSRDPEHSQRIAVAYEALKDERTKVATRLFGTLECADMETALMDLVRANTSRRDSPGLEALLEAEGVGDE